MTLRHYPKIIMYANGNGFSDVFYEKIILRRNWMNMGDTKIYSNYLTYYPYVLDKRFYSLSYVKRK